MTTPTDLHLAIINNDMATSRRLLSTHPKYASAKDELGFTPLHLACILGNYEACMLLLSFKADPRVEDKKQRNALHLAVFTKHEPIIELLLKCNTGIKVTSSLELSTVKKSDLTDIDTENEDLTDITIPSTLLNLSSRNNSVDNAPSAITASVSKSIFQSATRYNEDTTRSENTNTLKKDQLEKTEYLEFMKQRNFELVSKKVRYCHSLNEHLRCMMRQMEEKKYREIGSCEKQRNLESEDNVDIIERLRSQISNLRQKNDELEDLVYANTNSATIVSEDFLEKQKLFTNALAELLRENFCLKNKLDCLKGPGSYMDEKSGDELTSCLNEVKDYDYKKDNKSDGEKRSFSKFLSYLRKT